MLAIQGNRNILIIQSKNSTNNRLVIGAVTLHALLLGCDEFSSFWIRLTFNLNISNVNYLIYKIAFEL